MNTGKSYNTRQRGEIEKYFVLHPDECLTVRQTADGLRGAGLKVGDTTVYRVLTRLAEDGRLKRFISQGGGAYYQYNREGCRSHFHLKCLCCGRITHMQCDFMREMEKHISDSHDFQVDNSKTVIYGICSECARRGEGSGSDNG